jgi:hypothetical protein
MRIPTRLARAHSWPWWTAVGSLAGAVALIVALFAWWFPQSPSSLPSESTPGSADETGADRKEIYVDFHEQAHRRSGVPNTLPNSVLILELEYRNMSDKDQRGVVAEVQLPAEMTLLPGTTQLVNSGNRDSLILDDSIANGGVVIGSYSPEGNAFIELAVRISGKSHFTCDPKALTPQVSVSGNSETVTDEVTIQVSRWC